MSADGTLSPPAILPDGYSIRAATNSDTDHRHIYRFINIACDGELEEIIASGTREDPKTVMKKLIEKRMSCATYKTAVFIEKNGTPYGMITAINPKVLKNANHAIVPPDFTDDKTLLQIAMRDCYEPMFYVPYIAIDRQARGKKLGSALMDLMLRWISEIRPSASYILVLTRNTRARNWYINKGFSDTGKRAGSGQNELQLLKKVN